MEQLPAAIACSLSDRELAIRLDELTRTLLADALDITELDDGYALRFEGSPPNAQRLTTFVLGERQCCPFFRFDLHFEPYAGPITLILGGDAAIKAFTQTLLAGNTGADPVGDAEA